MRKNWWLGLALATMALSPAGARADAAEDKAVQKTLKTLVSAIRYSKDDTAAKQLGLGTMTQGLLGGAWAQLSAPEQQQAVKDVEVLMRKVAFTKGREMFQYLDAVLYQPVTVASGQAHCKSTVVVHRDLKKAEIPIEWVLAKEGGQWRVIDTVTMGESTAAGIRSDQVEPLLKEGGVPALVAALHKKAAEVSK